MASNLIHDDNYNYIVKTHFEECNIIISAFFPISIDPHSSATPKEAAPLIVAAAKDSSIVICILTHARCITNGYKRIIKIDR